MPRILTILLIGLLTAVPPAVQGGENSVQLFSGTYDWNDGGSDELIAEFKPTDGESWKVKFRFRFSGKMNSWKGTASGSLKDGGKISGRAKWSGRTWEFVGTVEGAVLRGSHTEIDGNGKRYDTGSFELKR